MVRSMIAGVAGLKAHQSKLDVIGNNIANVNTWGFKSYSYNFQDAMYSNSISSTGGSVIAGAAGGHNASQVGYGSTLSSISNEFTTGAPSPSSNSMDCMIDGTGFFLVGNMVNGTFTNVESSGLYLSRVGIFRVDNNGYLVDNLGSYVYGYAVEDGTGTPEITAKEGSVTLKDVPVTFTPPTDTAKATIEIAGIKTETTVTSKNDLEDAIVEWIDYVKRKAANEDGSANLTELNNLDFRNVNIEFAGIGKNLDSATLTITSKIKGTGSYDDYVKDIATKMGGQETNKVEGNDLVPSVAAEYSDELSTIRIPIDPDTNQRYEIQSWKMNEDGTIMGIDNLNRAIPIGQLALVTVENPNGLEKDSGYYYTVGANAGDVEAMKPNGGPAGIIKSGWLEMANVDLANEFSNMITTQRGFQANSKIITVTDEMLQELVNMKR